MPPDPSLSCSWPFSGPQGCSRAVLSSGPDSNLHTASIVAGSDNRTGFISRIHNSNFEPPHRRRFHCTGRSLWYFSAHLVVECNGLPRKISQTRHLCWHVLALACSFLVAVAFASTFALFLLLLSIDVNTLKQSYNDSLSWSTTARPSWP